MTCICVFDCIPPEFSPFRNLKKNIGKLNSLTVRKKKKKKSRPTDPIFKFWSGEGNITFFFWPNVAFSPYKVTIEYLRDHIILVSTVAAPNWILQALGIGYKIDATIMCISRNVHSALQCNLNES